MVQRQAVTCAQGRAGSIGTTTENYQSHLPGKELLFNPEHGGFQQVSMNLPYDVDAYRLQLSRTLIRIFRT